MKRNSRTSPQDAASQPTQALSLPVVPSFPLSLFPSSLSPVINFFHISDASIFVMWEVRSYVVSSVFCGIVSVRSQA